MMAFRIQTVKVEKNRDDSVWNQIVQSFVHQLTASAVTLVGVITELIKHSFCIHKETIRGRMAHKPNICLKQLLIKAKV